ncbi:nitroreductase family deazaflavin-dependent oxidoreductase [Rhodococcus fascians]|nr:nitroreductase family deazaflavin-dependent oxidoreductase [Rhodococcus fascians]MBY3995157.1 nitroreductase family deazaflavin-dependent oxidoreductase [Rhodococcus fascians]MBY4000523.1 nitroreductase family deazaflavin-dependent oxidoreductase [Rhodococcus fascians]MBY4005551.1 nitroreductase family deazaflavin-dependent oxidoreductase [Rhodococcus fascians]MBY4016384.1 nitroreductase family deazaflavin-dependent oxidoreductase [Rhodococcus fascians]
MADFNEMIIDEFRRNGGHVATAGFGDSLVVLHTIGAKSGAVRLNPLMAIPGENNWLVVGSAAGSPKDPAWVHNLRAHPAIDIEAPGDDGIRTVAVRAAEVPESEWDRQWQKSLDASEGFAKYTETAEGRRFPIFRLTPAAE